MGVQLHKGSVKRVKLREGSITLGSSCMGAPLQRGSVTGVHLLAVDLNGVQLLVHQYY